MVERFTAPLAGPVQLLPTGRKGGEWVRYSDYAELEAEVERLTRERDEALMVKREAVAGWRDAEALSRTGAVKAGLEQAAAIILAQIDSHPDWTPEQEAELRAHDPVATARSAARVAIKQCHRAILSALEPAAPEGQQPVAYRVHAPADEYYGIGPDRLQFHPLAQYDLDNGYRQTPLYTRPAEQAVTDEMVGAAEEVFFKTDDHGEPSYDMRAALEAALKKVSEAEIREDEFDIVDGPAW